MSAERLCPACGKPVPTDASAGLCPECLFKGAAQSAAQSAATGLYTASDTAIAPESGVRIKYFGDYELLGEIARGGMGVVWKARQASLNREVAVKMIRAGVLASTAEVDRFLREAEAAANLQHPNIVAIHEVGEHNGQHYFSMDYVAGRDLGALVKDGPLPPRSAARYVKIVAEAIHFAHQRGTLHRDLKPQNVLIDQNDQPRITDFGLAKLMNDESGQTQTGVAMGSPSYMPPEQATGQHADVGPASDVYSLGAMLYELLTGRPPFRGATALATLREVVESEPAPPRRVNADIPPDLETVCLKCLEKNPTARYATARALAEELGRFLAGEPIQARPASGLRKAMSWTRRHPGTLAAGCALVVVVLAFGVYYLIEENAFLRAQQTDPAIARAAGPLSEVLQVWNTINTLAMLLGIYLLLFLRMRGRKVSFRDWSDPARFAGPSVPLGDGLRTFVAVLGVMIVAAGVGLLVVAIQANVWEGAPILSQAFTVYATIYFGSFAVVTAIRDYWRTNVGVPARTLTPEQTERIRQAMETFDVLTAVKRYREAVPEADVAEARDFALRLADSLRASHPGKYVLPPLTLRALNWPLMGVALMIGAVIVALLWVLMPPVDATAFVLQFAQTFLFGVGLMAGTRVKGFWKRLLLLAPAFILMFGGERLSPHPPRIPLAYVTGAVFGLCLMMTGFTPRRRTGAA